VSYLDGAALAEEMRDADISGNVAISFGAGRGAVTFDGGATNLPLLIHGNLSVAGKGDTGVRVGEIGAGAVVGKNFKVTGGAAADGIDLNRLTVNGSTTLSLGNGDNSVTINDSLFAGNFTLTTGAGADVVNLETTPGTGAVTTFDGAVKMSLGAGVDYVGFGGSADANQALIFAGGCVVHHGAEGELADRFGKELYPFGGDLQWVV